MYNACNLLFLCSCKIFPLNPLALILLTKHHSFIPSTEKKEKKKEAINLASESLKVIAQSFPQKVLLFSLSHFVF